MSVNILITGSKGQLGSSFKDLQLNFPDYNFFFTDSNSLDIANREQITDFFEQNKINYCINCAAYTAVDKAETDQKLAFTVNSAAVQNLAIACQKHNTVLFHYSTDYVFNGENYKPYLETDPTNPINYYGETKLAGENLAKKFNPKTLILRTSWVYSSYGHNFVKTMLKLGKEKNELKIISDQIGSPTFAPDLTLASMHIINSLQENPNFTDFGIYNYSGEGVCSWYDFASSIFEIKNLECKTIPIETKEYPTPAKRPYYSVLNKTKIKQTFGLKINHWQDSLKKFLNSYI